MLNVMHSVLGEVCHQLTVRSQNLNSSGHEADLQFLHHESRCFEWCFGCFCVSCNLERPVGAGYAVGNFTTWRRCSDLLAAQGISFKMAGQIFGHKDHLKCPAVILRYIFVVC